LSNQPAGLIAHRGQGQSISGKRPAFDCRNSPQKAEV
jgi:hypothetical protein